MSDTSLPLVRDCMSTLSVMLRSDRTLEEAQKLMGENGFVAVPVVNPAGAIMGVLSDFGLLKCFLKRDQVTPQMIFIGNYTSEFEPILTVNEDEPLSEAFRKMLQAPSKRIFVLENEQIVGKIEPSDVYDLMSSRSTGRRFRGEIAEPNKAKLPRATATEKAVMEGGLYREAPVAIYSCRLDGVILSGNRALHCLVDHHQDDLVGRSLQQLYPVAFHKDVFEGLQKILISGFLPAMSLAFVKKDTQLIKVDVTQLLRRDTEQKPSHVIGIASIKDPQIAQDMIEKLKAIP